MSFENFIGIDISKETLDLALLCGNGNPIALKCENQRSSIKKTLETILRDYGLIKDSVLICAEHTGHFGNKLIGICLEMGYKLWLEGAYAILHSQGLTRGKNDRIDARRIAEYARRFVDRAIIYRPSSKSVEKLKNLAAERDMIVRDIAKYNGQIKQEEGFLEKGYFSAKKDRLKRLINYNEKILAEIEADIDNIISNDELIRDNLEKIVSIEGVGRQTAIATIVATGNFTKFDNAKQFACHSGCAPFRYESGTSRTSRNKVSHRANKNLKKVFHMAALATLRTKGELRMYYDRKVAEGKNKMSVINAIRAKLIARIFAVVKGNRKYDKIYTHTLV